MRITNALVASLAGGACLALGVLGAASAQAHSPEQAHSAASLRAVRTCEVNQDHVPVYSGAGTGHTLIRYVDKGQWFSVYDAKSGWYHGDLWGGQKSVWIQDRFLSKC
ncbi:hypothetical protein ACFP1Z_12475 [Streptomyces gamaensis]|uniref:SH3 domain-containing protein n=1 Tax=Streptomyces gamaensis TaxID=1763542 RepID=A0ABW0YZW8_9ACTN